MANKKSGMVHGLVVRNNITDLGNAQISLENATKKFKASHVALVKAQQAFTDAEAEYESANKTLLNGLATLREATKIRF